jgi:hypothetical protein
MIVRKNICWVIIVSHDLPVRECKIFVRWKIFVRFKKYLVNARGRGQDGHFGVRPHPSELINGVNLTDYGRNVFGVKKKLAQWLVCPAKLFSDLCVQCIFLIACVSKSPIGRVRRARPHTPHGTSARQGHCRAAPMAGRRVGRRGRWAELLTARADGKRFAGRLLPAAREWVHGPAVLLHANECMVQRTSACLLLPAYEQGSAAAAPATLKRFRIRSKLSLCIHEFAICDGWIGALKKPVSLKHIIFL